MEQAEAQGKRGANDTRKKSTGSTASSDESSDVKIKASTPEETEDPEKERQKKIQKRKEAIWMDKYQFFSHPLATKIGTQNCEGFDKTKRRLPMALKTEEDHADPGYR